MRHFRIAHACIVATLALGSARAVEPDPAPFPHPYAGEAFDRLVDDSCSATGAMDRNAFHQWMAARLLTIGRSWPYGRDAADWETFLKAQREDMESTGDLRQRARKQHALAAWLHATVKKALPNYDLEHGFELAYAARDRQRQCLMGSLLISSLLQAAGVDAGMMMMNQNVDGEFTNNTHVVAVMKLANGNDAVVDASYGWVNVAHRGLMGMDSDGRYRYVRPIYTPDGGEIMAYREEPTRRQQSTKDVRPLDAAFALSQIYYYRGERTPGGVLAKRTSREGLDRSVRFFDASLALAPRNPLPAYMLAKAYELQGRREDAFRQYTHARNLYGQAGWTPDEVSRALNRTRPAKRVAAQEPGTP